LKKGGRPEKDAFSFTALTYLEAFQMDDLRQNGQEWRDLLRHVGTVEQLAGINRFTYTSGKRDGIHAFEMYNNAGLHYTVMESRCLDIYNLWYKGTPIPPISKPGMVAAPFADLHGVNYLRSISGGLLYTCGLSNVGGPFQEDGVDDIFHGRIRFIPAENCGSYAGEESGDYVLRISGEMRDASLFYENLVLKREISTSLNSKTITIHDTVENRGVTRREFMFMYHLNCGYPVLDAGCNVYIPSAGVKPMSPSAEKLINTWDMVSGPSDTIPDDIFVHSLLHDENGLVHAALYNEKIGLGVSYSFDFRAMEYIVQWRCLKSTDYVMGLFPSNNHCAGREFERQNGTIKHIDPFEQKKLGVAVTIIDGEKDLEDFKRKLRGCSRKGTAL
jgi:hypothetical protein